ncbi:hypothetical protein L3V67_00415 [Levilactobacillus sp. HBUAS51416]|nr:hypothetical protein [Levilactobacillus tujiorum]
MFKITSKFKNKSTRIQRFYFPITFWRQAGLSKQSYVDIHQVYSLTARAVFQRKPIGKLVPNDILALRAFLRRYQREI